MADESKLNRNLVLDSSVVIKWFSEEEGTDMALSIREKHINGEVEVVVPDLLLYEISNALRYNKNIDEDEVKEAVESIVKLGIDIIVPTREIMDLAISYAFKYNLTVYDAYFLSLASMLQFGCVTADEKLFNKVKELGFVTILKDFSFEEEENNP